MHEETPWLDEQQSETRSTGLDSVVASGHPDSDPDHPIPDSRLHLIMTDPLRRAAGFFASRAILTLGWHAAFFFAELVRTIDWADYG